MEQSYKEKYEDILARLAKAKNDNEVCDERFCCVINEIIPELAESEDEKIRKALIDFFGKGAKYGGQTNGVYDKDILAWLEKQKGNIGGISPNSAWSEEDEQHVNSLLKRLEGICKKGATYTATRFPVSQDIDWLKSIKERKGGKI